MCVPRVGGRRQCWPCGCKGGGRWWIHSRCFPFSTFNKGCWVPIRAVSRHQHMLVGGGGGVDNFSNPQFGDAMMIIKRTPNYVRKSRPPQLKSRGFSDPMYAAERRSLIISPPTDMKTQVLLVKSVRYDGTNSFTDHTSSRALTVSHIHPFTPSEIPHLSRSNASGPTIYVFTAYLLVYMIIEQESPIPT